MLVAGSGASEVEAIGVIRVLAMPSAFKTVLASFIHSKKFVPSELNGVNIKDCILLSRKEGFVDITSLRGGLLAINSYIQRVLTNSGEVEQF
jgi:hypothetical protein